MKSLTLFSILFLLLSTGCRQQEPFSEGLTEEDIQTIHRLEQEYAVASQAGDVDDMLALRTDSTVIIPPGEPAVQGKESLREYYRSLPLQLVNYELTPLQTVGTGELAYNRGDYTLTAVTGRDTVSETGKYVQVWQEQADDEWLLTLEIWNTSEMSQQLDIE